MPFECELREILILDFCANYCLNGGTCTMENQAPKCTCPQYQAVEAGTAKKFSGIRCESVSIRKLRVFG